jgi:hypothetical protein
LPEQFDFRRCHWFVHFLLLLAVGRWDWAIGNSPVLHALGIGRMSPRFCFVSFVSGLAKTTRGHEQIASGTPAGGLEKDCRLAVQRRGVTRRMNKFPIFCNAFFSNNRRREMGFSLAESPRWASASVRAIPQYQAGERDTKQ